MGLIDDIPQVPNTGRPTGYEGENVPTSARGYPLGSAHLLTLQESPVSQSFLGVRAELSSKKEPRGLREVNLSSLVPG